MLKLIKPNEKYYKQYKEMIDEWNNIDENGIIEILNHFCK